ncbi:hypothetical protein F5887DRAFT_348809 [Amanita rubescens]|nr:hypothetical protein F5887DRAFT_348809 [Amanita rubescens]
MSPDCNLFARSSLLFLPHISSPMVKFTFTSVFLILTAMSALVFAAPTDFAKYSVKIRGTDFFVLSDGTERAGQPISMVTGYNPDTTVVSINLAPVGFSVSKVIGKAGLLVTVRGGPDGAPYLVWDTPDGIRAHFWRFENLVPEIDYLISDVGRPFSWYIYHNNVVLRPGKGDLFTIRAV